MTLDDPIVDTCHSLECNFCRPESINTKFDQKGKEISISKIRYPIYLELGTAETGTEPYKNE
ncbi:hypothetical protein JOC94_002694 [Bacillus thermophilus]|uniref:Uncharacterized protein n=1 Tax=Siminovitchia thermophila TaxID=1245522 RepID=A0ABS2R7S6_9BACI|nr:hypothetical protein [Siminovitchia thermophila]